MDLAEFYRKDARAGYAGVSQKSEMFRGEFDFVAGN